MSLTNNKTKIQSLLDGINALPDAGGVDLPELTNEGEAVDLVSGKELINSSGAVVTGTNPYSKNETDATVSTQADLIAQIQTALADKVAASPSEDVTEEVAAYTSLLPELEDVINTLPDAGGGSSGGAEIPTVSISVVETGDLGGQWNLYHSYIENGSIACGLHTVNQGVDTVCNTIIRFIESSSMGGIEEISVSSADGTSSCLATSGMYAFIRIGTSDTTITVKRIAD